MAKAIYNLDRCEGYKDDRGCMYAPSCSVCKYGRENKAKQISELLAKQGYRKASEVAREIFEEIEKLLRENQSTLIPPYRSEITDWKTVFRLKLADDIAELKKKYTEEKKDV
jgi:hypothetical protein